MTRFATTTTGFFVNAANRTIDPISYIDYLSEYGQDLLTTRDGIGNRIVIHEAKELAYVNAEGADIWESEYDELEAEEQDSYRYAGEQTKEWQVFEWRSNGQRLTNTGISFDNEADADQYLYESFEGNLESNEAPQFFADYEDAVKEFAEIFERSLTVVHRYFAIKAITTRKDAEHRAQVTREYNARQEWLKTAVPAEAESLQIDNEFREAIKWAETATGRDKSDRMASAMKGLLQRNGKEVIESDFWQVLRILKQKAYIS